MTLSLLHERGACDLDAVVPEPTAYRDLNFDLVVAHLTQGREEYGLTSTFHHLATAPEDVLLRQGVLQDADRADVGKVIGAFAQAMRDVRRSQSASEKFYHPQQKRRLVLDGSLTYCRAVVALRDGLREAQPSSRGFRHVLEHLDVLTASEPFRVLATGASELTASLSALAFHIDIAGQRVSLPDCEEAVDYSLLVEGTFRRFRQADAPAMNFAGRETDMASPVEERILDALAQWHPALTKRVFAFTEGAFAFLDPDIVRLDRELQFFKAYLDYIAPLRAAGLPFCYPEVLSAKAMSGRATFDLALAHRLVRSAETPVTNDFDLPEGGAFLVVTGPNQGGKTTFARAIGQLHVLTRLGLMTPGADVRTFLSDQVLTHFERGENRADVVGKLHDDLVRAKAVVDQSGDRSVAILNEIFTSTTLDDARDLSRRIYARLRAAGAVGVWVTFVDEVAQEDGAISYASQVDPTDPTVRTFKILRSPPAGVAYALSIAAKHGLTFEQLTMRLQP